MEIFEKVHGNMITVSDYRILSELPELMRLDSGKPVKDRSDWDLRRKELFETAVRLQYGELPPEPEILDVTLLHSTRFMKRSDVPMHNYLIKTGTAERPFYFKMQVILPGCGGKPCPVIVDGDMCWTYHLDGRFLDAAISRGIGWVLFDRTVIADDVNDRGRRNGRIYETYPDLDCGALMAWAWGYKICVDAVLKLSLPVDRDFIAFSGHSRGGKTALLAGVIDPRASIVNPNSSGAGGAGCYRFVMNGQCAGGDPFRSETLDDLLNVFPFWFGPSLGDFYGRASALPFDEHFLKALVAPRTLFISESCDDIWANPLGTLLTTRKAEPAFRLTGAADSIFWYYRPGKHAHTYVDVEMLANVINHKRSGEPVDGRMFVLPFDDKPISKDHAVKQ